QAPFRLAQMTASGEAPITSGLLAELFRRPHPHLDAFAFWELLVTWLDLRGECFLIATDALGTVLSLDDLRRESRRSAQAVPHLLVLNPDDFTEIITDHALAGWRYRPCRFAAPLPELTLLPNDVIHIKLPNPFNFWRGMSPLSVAALAAQTDYASAQ